MMKMIHVVLAALLILVPNGLGNKMAMRRSSMSLADDAGCQGRLALSKFAKVNQICEECHSLFKELEVYRLCRADCFGTKFYYGCMEVLLVEEDLKKQVSSILEEAHSGYYDPLSKK